MTVKCLVYEKSFVVVVYMFAFLGPRQEEGGP